MFRMLQQLEEARHALAAAQQELTVRIELEEEVRLSFTCCSHLLSCLFSAMHLALCSVYM